MAYTDHTETNAVKRRNLAGRFIAVDMPNGYKHRARCHPQRWHHAHGLCKTCYQKEWSKTYTRKAAIRHAQLAKLGWTQDRKNDFFRKQKGLCAICGLTMRPPHADHKHGEPPIPRGLLCPACNKGLGFFEDNTDRLRNAISYVQMYTF